MYSVHVCMCVWMGGGAVCTRWMCGCHVATRAAVGGRTEERTKGGRMAVVRELCWGDVVVVDVDDVRRGVVVVVV